MVLQPGREAEAGRQPVWPLRVFFATGRLVGFLLLAVPAMGILGAVVLIPEYARLQELTYERDVEKALKGDYETAIESRDRFNRGMMDDEGLVKRFAMSELNLQPRNEYVSAGPPVTTKPIGAITPYYHPRPPAPPGWLVNLSAKLEDPGKRRGLLLLAAGALLAAMFLFSPPEKYRRRDGGKP